MKLPKIAELLSPVADMETQLKSQLESTTGMSLPPGPVEMTKSIVEQVEDSLPELPLPDELPGMKSLSNVTSNAPSLPTPQTPGSSKSYPRKVMV